MNRKREIFIHLLPVLLGVVLTVALSALVYFQMVDMEEDQSMEQLQTVTVAMSEKVAIRFEDNMNLLERVGDALLVKEDLGHKDSILGYLEDVCEESVFDRIDILLPDETIIHLSGDSHKMEEGNVPFATLVSMGNHYSQRYTDHTSGEEVLYCSVVLEEKGKAVAVLMGVVECDNLPNLFKTYSFDGTGQLFILDQRDGKFLMDSWHEELSSVQEMDTRQMEEGYDQEKWINNMMTGQTGHVAFVSKSNGAVSYMSYMPIEGYPWSMAVMVQEDEVLENVQELSRMLQYIGAMEGVLLLSYVGWNLFVAKVLVKQRENVRKMELEAESNKAKSLFLNSVSHDIRTPLNGILGMLDVIDHRRDVPDGLNSDLEKIRVSANYLVTLANNMLDLSDLERGSQDIQEDHIDLSRLKEELRVIIQERLKVGTVTFRMDDVNLDHPYVLGSDGYLHRILTNLIGNAIKYSKENGSVWVDVEELPDGEGQSLYRFTVRDDGIGMSEEFMNKLFQAFEQENSGARSKNTGHGLGLAIVDRMVKQMNGTVTVESEKGVGSIFAVTVPLRWDPEGGRVAQEASQEEADIRGARILLAEDNELNMEIATLLLEDAGAHITQAFNGRQAVEIFMDREPYYFDVILMDIMMPEMDGCEAARRLREMGCPDSRDIPIIAMTASTFTEDIRRCKDAGMNDHIGKPLDMDNVITLVARYREIYKGHKR